MPLLKRALLKTKTQERRWPGKIGIEPLPAEKHQAQWFC
jgi:hypothetical protein